MGGTDERTDGRTNKQTNKSPPVFYRTSSPSGPLPCFLSLQITIMQIRATGIADHILPLGDLLFLFQSDPRLPDQSLYDVIRHIQACQSHQDADQIGSGSKPVFASSGVGTGAIQRLNRICFCRHLRDRVFVVRSIARIFHHVCFFADGVHDGIGHLHSTQVKGSLFCRHDVNDDNDNDDHEDVSVYKMAVG